MLALPPNEMTHKRPLRSIGRRLMLVSIMCGLTFTLMTVTVRTWTAWHHNIATMNNELILIDQVYQKTLTKALWEVDNESLQGQFEQLAQVRSLGRLTLSINKAGREPEILTMSREEFSDTISAPSLERMLTYEPYPGGSETVGRLLLEGNEQLLRQRLLRLVISIVISQILEALLLAGVIIWVFNRSVTVHVRHLARHLGQLTPYNLKQTLHLSRSTANHDELSLLTDGVNGLQNKLSTYIEQQRQNEQDLAAHRDHLAYLVQERTAELSAANQLLETLSRRDSLTNLANRRHFDECKDIEFRRASRHGHPLSVLMCDLDHFKRYNDTYGHPLGDKCLQAVAKALERVFARAGDLVARIGGEEFAVLLPGTDSAQACTAAERLRAELAKLAIEHCSSPVAAHVTMSIGVAQLESETMAHFDMLMLRADQALYRAKSQGRNRISI